MGTIQRAAVYKLTKKKKFLIHTVSSIQMGAGIATEPFRWLDGNTPLSEVVEELMNALSNTRIGLANPTNWEETAKEFLKNVGLEKQSDLYKDSLHVSVVKKDGVLFFTPMKNLGSKGFTNVSKEKIEVDEN